MQINRNRGLYFFLIISTIVIGLASRSSFIPRAIYSYLGDVLYALMCYFIIGFLFPRMDPLKVALVSVLLCSLIEISQLYKADWIMQIRQTRLGGLILGLGFLWSDLISYFIGGLMGLGFEWLTRRSTTSHPE